MSLKRFISRFAVFTVLAGLVLATLIEPSAAATNGNSIVQAIAPPKNPLPSEEASAGVTKFSFIVYGDTRGRRDGKAVQYEHSLIIDSMLDRIKKLATNEFPVRFVLQTGDAVVDGRDARQWNASFVSLINRITTEGGVPYFLAPGNHDVTSASELTSTNRARGLSNYLAAVSQLIPPDGATRRLNGFPTFAFGYGNSFFIALDSNLATDKTQLAWTTDQLEGLDRDRWKNVFVYLHHPPFSSGPHGGAKEEAPSIALRQDYLPLFRKHRVAALFAGHEHFFEHWVERYQDRQGRKHRMDHIITGGGGAPLYAYRGQPNTDVYLKSAKDDKVELQHLVPPGPKRGDNPYHYVIFRVDGEEFSLEVVGVDWGSDFQPYRSNSAELTQPKD